MAKWVSKELGEVICGKTPSTIEVTTMVMKFSSSQFQICMGDW
jgi:hypothetical protein